MYTLQHSRVGLLATCGPRIIPILGLPGSWALFWNRRHGPGDAKYILSFFIDQKY